MAEPLTIAAAPGPLAGEVSPPGDKSISHRALMLAALAVGESTIDGLLEGEDVLATAAALRAMGVTIERGEEGRWHVHGVGVGGLLQPDTALAMGNSGTSTRLLMGLVASHHLTATFVGDASLSARPMARVIEPLRQTGAEIVAAPGGRLPLVVRGLQLAVPLTWRLPVPSAQVKSAVLLAGLNTPGITTVIEPVATRDHSERMLRAFGARLDIGQADDGARSIALHGEAELVPQRLTIPGDPSSATFWAVAAAIVPNSAITLRGVGLNRTRTGALTILRAMGAALEIGHEREAGGEPVGDLTVRAGPLDAVEPDPALAPTAIDEYPALFVAAAFARGRSVFRGLAELRVKESDRLAAMAATLRALGVPVEELADGLAITGSDGAPLPGGGAVATRLDHRVAMSAAVAALHCRRPVSLDDAAPIATSYPAFHRDGVTLGAWA